MSDEETSSGSETSSAESSEEDLYELFDRMAQHIRDSMSEGRPSFEIWDDFEYVKNSIRVFHDDLEEMDALMLAEMLVEELNDEIEEYDRSGGGQSSGQSKPPAGVFQSEGEEQRAFMKAKLTQMQDFVSEKRGVPFLRRFLEVLITLYRSKLEQYSQLGLSPELMQHINHLQRLFIDVLRDEGQDVSDIEDIEDGTSQSSQASSKPTPTSSYRSARSSTPFSTAPTSLRSTSSSIPLSSSLGSWTPGHRMSPPPRRGWKPEPFEFELKPKDEPHEQDWSGSVTVNWKDLEEPDWTRPISSSSGSPPVPPPRRRGRARTGRGQRPKHRSKTSKYMSSSDESDEDEFGDKDSDSFPRRKHERSRGRSRRGPSQGHPFRGGRSRKESRAPEPPPSGTTHRGRAGSRGQGRSTRPKRRAPPPPPQTSRPRLSIMPSTQASPPSSPPKSRLALMPSSDNISSWQTLQNLTAASPTRAPRRRPGGRGRPSYRETPSASSASAGFMPAEEAFGGPPQSLLEQARMRGRGIGRATSRGSPPSEPEKLVSHPSPTASLLPDGGRQRSPLTMSLETIPGEPEEFEEPEESGPPPSPIPVSSSSSLSFNGGRQRPPLNAIQDYRKKGISLSPIPEEPDELEEPTTPSVSAPPTPAPASRGGAQRTTARRVSIGSVSRGVSPRAASRGVSQRATARGASPSATPRGGSSGSISRGVGQRSASRGPIVRPQSGPSRAGSRAGSAPSRGTVRPPWRF